MKTNCCYPFKEDIYFLENSRAYDDLDRLDTSKIDARKGLVKYGELVERSALFTSKHPFPTTNNLIQTLATEERKIQEIELHADQTHPIIHERVIPLIKHFLEEKRMKGNLIEQTFYQQLDVQQFIDRLLHQRPLVFITRKDIYLLRDGSKGKGGFEKIGSEEEKQPLTLENYLSYEEMQISAMLGISTSTQFINRGWRNNRGAQSEEGTFEERGIYVGLVGARLEKPGFMEWKRVMITPEQNTKENGYGIDTDLEEHTDPVLQMWADFYGCGEDGKAFFPSYEEALMDTSGKYLSIGKNFLNVNVYKQRIRMIIEPFLLEANARARQAEKKAYVHAVGFGLGVWKASDIQGQLMMDVYSDIIRERDLSDISDINFAWFPDICISCGEAGGEEFYTTEQNRIKIHFSKRNPAMKLDGEDSGKLLVASYAWDSNSYPGNEYWLGSDYLAASGDPAAACCSMIELQIPEINPNLSGKNTHVFR